MPQHGSQNGTHLTGHALRNAHLRARSLERACTAPPLARAIVTIRAGTLGMTRLEFARRSGISNVGHRCWAQGDGPEAIAGRAQRQDGEFENYDPARRLGGWSA